MVARRKGQIKDKARGVNDVMNEKLSPERSRGVTYEMRSWADHGEAGPKRSAKKGEEGNVLVRKRGKQKQDDERSTLIWGIYAVCIPTDRFTNVFDWGLDSKKFR